jgi:VWFA-related protein
MRRFTTMLLAAALASAQQRPPEEGMAKFTSTSQLVVEAVSVTGRNGQPMEGLKAEDFAITENGVPQTIRLFEFQTLSSAARVVRAAGGEPQGGPPVDRISPEKPGALKYANRRLMVLYFDTAAMPVEDRLRALEAAEKFTEGSMTDSDAVAVMERSGGAVRVRQDFTGDRDRLREVIRRMMETSLRREDSVETFDPGGAFGQDEGEFNLFNTDRQIAALQTAVNLLAPLVEKKIFVYFASGLSMHGVDNLAQLRATLNAAIRANVSFWPIDARGLMADAPMGDFTTASPSGAGAYNGSAAMAAAASRADSQDTLYTLAADTGGKAMFDYNDLARGIVKAQQALSSYYLIGYYTTNTALDGKYRRIEVRLKEFPQARMDYRRGYYGGKEYARFTAADKERQLEEALMQEDPVTELTISMEVNYFQLNGAEYYVPVTMKIPGSELALARKRGAERTRIDFIGLIKDETDMTVANLRDKVDAELSKSTAAELARRTVEYDSGYTLLPGSYTIKVLARDAETGRIGTYLSRFTIPNLAKEKDRIPLSTMVLSSERLSMEDALFTAGQDKEQTANPLVQDRQKLVPSVTRVFRRTREMFVYLQAYEPGTDAFQPLLAYVTFFRNQVKAFETVPLAVREGMGNRIRTVPLKFRLVLSELPTGRYECLVTVVNPSGRKAAFRQAAVMVAP